MWIRSIADSLKGVPRNRGGGFCLGIRQPLLLEVLEAVLTAALGTPRDEPNAAKFVKAHHFAGQAHNAALVHQ
jgi:hypothetical protein